MAELIMDELGINYSLPADPDCWNMDDYEDIEDFELTTNFKEIAA